MFDKAKAFLKKTFRDLVTINDTPHRIAGGFAVGVFFGILPAAGPMAAVVMAYALRVNRIAAFAGGLLTNTWLSVVTFVLAVKIGSFVTGTEYHEIYNSCKELMKNFHWREVFNEPILKILKPVFAGYAVIGALAGVAAYFLSLYIVIRRKNRKSYQA